MKEHRVAWGFLPGHRGRDPEPEGGFVLLAFLPQFVSSEGSVVLQILLLGAISVALNTTADLVVAGFAGSVGRWWRQSVRFRRGQRIFSGFALIGLGAYVAVSGERK